MNSPLNISVSCFKNALCKQPVTVNLMTWLTSAKFKSLVEQIRATTDKTQRDFLKKQLPAITPSGIFSHRAKAGLINHSRLMAFDIDFKGNNQITNYNDLKAEIANLKEIAYCGLSASGNGFWGLIPIKYPEKHESHFKALEIAFMRWGIKIDPACKDVCRLRFYSFDPNAYFNHNAEIFTRLIKPAPNEQPFVNLNFTLDKRPIEIAVKMIHQAPDDEKWHTLTKASYLLGGYIATGAISESEARQTLQNAISAKTNVTNLQAAFRTIDAGLKDGQAKPIYQPIRPEPIKPLNTNTEFLRQTPGLRLTESERLDFMAFCEHFD